MAYRPAANKAYGQTRRKAPVSAAKLQQLASSSVQPSYASRSVMTANAVQSNISSLALFLAKYLSGKNNVVISPDPNSNGYSVGKRKLVNGQIIYDIHVPHWNSYKLPLNDKDKYRVYRSGVWHEAQHVAETPDQVFTFGTRGEEVKEPLAHDTINILEDRRIEDIGVEKWPGYASERLFTNAYAWTRRMDVGAFWNAYLKMHYDDVNRMYLKDEEYIRERKGHMRHEAFLQRLLVMKIKGWDQLPIGERDLIEHEATMVEHELTKLRKQSPETIYRKLAQLSMQVIKDLELKDYVPEVTHIGESTWDQSFKPHTPAPGESQETRIGIDDYFDQLMTVEVVCSGCGKHYTRKLGVRED